MSLIKNMLYKYKMRRNPAVFLRKLGTEIGENCEIYPTANFMDPYLIKLGNKYTIENSPRVNNLLRKKPLEILISRGSACVRGFEPPTFWSVAKRSIQLS